MGEERIDILGLTPEALAAWVATAGEPAYRVRQILDGVYAQRIESFDALSNVPRALRERLAEAFALSALKEVDRVASADGATGKIVFELPDGGRIESVWMNDRGRQTFCISSQAGCALGCRFCATGAAGFGRDLTVGEILGQVTALARHMGELRNIV
ncbi:MAG: 23S rRNA (adenine(2503)-C(2))-methyltransferase RlmN, partial [Candidatus Methylomirabilota bacterium]